MAETEERRGDNCKIAVLVAARNGERYLGEQLDSILSQEGASPAVIVSDDCSEDGTARVLREYERRFPGRVAAIYRKKPSGGAAAHFLWLLRLAALSVGGAACGPSRSKEALEEICQAAGEEALDRAKAAAGLLESASFFMLSDQDDVWLPQKAARLLEQLQKRGEECPGKPLLIHSDLSVTDGALKVIAPSFFAYQKVDPSRTALPQLLAQNVVTGGAVMINRPMAALLEEVPEICLMHDAWLALAAACFGEILCVREPLYLYRQHGENALGAQKGDSPKEALGRLADGSRARENYRRMFGQASCLLAIYGDRLSERQREILKAFAGLPQRGRLGKIAQMLRYGFTKDTWLRTLGQMIFMGD